MAALVDATFSPAVPEHRAPFPFFGGKSAVGRHVWAAFGGVGHYVEPFAGSLGVLLSVGADPTRAETVNDLDGYVTNVWRAIQRDPEAVAAYAAQPVNECDLTARHLWLIGPGRPDVRRLASDPDWFDAKAAGWWVWGRCCWIGSGWCDGDGPWTVDAVLSGERQTGAGGVRWKLPHLGDAGRGVHRQLPHLGNAGRGVHRQLPHLGDAGRGVHRQRVEAWLCELAERLERVRVACGDWSRVCTEAVLLGPRRRGPVGVFLDPPYRHGNGSTRGLYAEDGDVADAAAAWAFAHGDDPAYRIALCGWAGDAEAPAGWWSAAWSRPGGSGYANQSGRAPQATERIWFSPHCRRPDADRPRQTGLPLLTALAAD
jgi:hypothetical protein